MNFKTKKSDESYRKRPQFDNFTKENLREFLKTFSNFDLTFLFKTTSNDEIL